MKLNNKYNYQTNFSENNHSVLSSKIRIKKSKKIFSVIKHSLGKKVKTLNQMSCLDIGGSAGFTAKVMSPFVKKIFIIDIDKKALDFGKNKNYAKNIIYKVDDAMNLHFKDNSIDIVVCNQVYEHVPDSQKLMSEIYRVLKKDGLCYMGVGNKYSFIEHHYKLPFLSWFPKSVSNLYLRLMKKGTFYYENHLSYWGLKKLFFNFTIDDYTINIINNPKKFHATDMINEFSFITKIPPIFIKLLEPLLPGYVFILKKDEDYFQNN